MERTQISLDAEERALLDRAAAETGRSMSSLIREAVRSTYGGGSVGPRDLEALDAAFGSWGPGRPDGEQWVERLRSGDRIRSR